MFLLTNPDLHHGLLGHFENFPNSPRREILLGELALALENELQHLPEVCLRLVEGLTLRNRRRNLFHEAGISTFFGGFEYSSKLHAPRVSQPILQTRQGSQFRELWLPSFFELRFLLAPVSF